MDQVMDEYISKLNLGAVKEFGDMSVIPIFTPIKGPEYLTLKEALDADQLIITEIDESGRVSELKVKNTGDVPVLLLDGEEIIGAKQNRVLNTTILVAAGAEIEVPVSCTEQGRWSYRSRRFTDSDVIAAHRVRRSKSRSVHLNLKNEGNYRSNQMEVWNEIDEISMDAKVKSPTRAMKDVYNTRSGDLKEYMEAFTPEENQKGIMVLINGEVAGFEVLSSEKAYKLLHNKLIKSYAMEAILSHQEKSVPNDAKQAETFIDEAKQSEETSYKSLGYGCDHRFSGVKLSGSSLIYDANVIHSAFFKIPY